MQTSKLADRYLNDFFSYLKGIFLNPAMYECVHTLTFVIFPLDISEIWVMFNFMHVTLAIFLKTILN